jgi:hypothetical protein
MNSFLIFLLISLIIVFVYINTEYSIERYTDKQYFSKFKNKSLSKLKSNNKLSIPKNKKNKILIITYDNRPRLSYIKHHNKNISEYCSNWGYHYKFFDKCSYNKKYNLFIKYSHMYIRYYEEMIYTCWKLRENYKS